MSKGDFAAVSAIVAGVWAMIASIMALRAIRLCRQVMSRLSAVDAALSTSVAAISGSAVRQFDAIDARFRELLDLTEGPNPAGIAQRLRRERDEAREERDTALAEVQVLMERIHAPPKVHKAANGAVAS